MQQAKPSTLSFLKRHVPSDERIVNRLFVSAFLASNKLKVSRSSFLLNYVVSNNDDEYEILQNVLQHLSVEYGKRIKIETLVKLFEYVVSPADRIVTGAVYTPHKVRAAILQKCLGDKDSEMLQRMRVADISCGCGGFLMDAALWIHNKTGRTFAEIYQDNIYGIDVQAYAIERTKILLSLLALSEGEDSDFEFNLLCRDTLDFVCQNWNGIYSGFDVIVGNPPYVCSRNLPEETRSKLKYYEVCNSGHPDLYIPFFQIATEMLADRGRLGLITMNTFLKSINGRALRTYFSQHRFAISIVDFRGYQIFDSRNTYTCLFYLDKTEGMDSIHYAVDSQGILSDTPQYETISYDILDDIKGWGLNSIEETIAIESTGIQIKDYCSSRHGIATLSNSTYIFKPVGEDATYFILESEGKRYPIEKEICRDIINPNKLNTVEQMSSIIEKIIFPYIIENGKASIIDIDNMCRNYPRTLEYFIAKKHILLSRDKENTSSYPQWYAFGRTQSLVLPKYKLFFPKYANRQIKCIISDDPKLTLYNGLAFVNSEIRKLKILKIIIESEMFWHYIQKNGKPYASGYYSLTGVDIKHFGIPFLSIEEEDELLSMTDKSEIDNRLKMYYNIE